MADDPQVAVHHQQTAPAPAGQAVDTRRLLYLLWPALAWTYIFLFFAWFHLRPVGVMSTDTYYHARCAQMFPQRGLAQEFPWTQASIWKERYCNKEFLYHALMAPFALDEQAPLNGVRWFGLLLNVGVVVALFLVLRAEGVRWPLGFTFLLLVLGGIFLHRFLQIRSHVLSILLMVIGLHFIFRRQWKALLALGFLYSWSYSFPFVLFMVAAPVALGCWLGGDKLEWKSPVAAAAGSAVGLAIHPFSPYTLDNFLAIVQNVHISLGMSADAAMRLGQENYPHTTREYLILDPALVVVLAALCLAGWRLGRRLSPLALGVLCAAFCWLVAMAFLPRFEEYAVPLVVVGLALAVRDLLAGVDLRAAFASVHPWKLRAAVGGLAVFVVAGHLYCAYLNWGAISLAPPPRFRCAAQWMAAHLEPGETVVNLSWADFPELFYDGCRQHYLTGMDLTYSFRYDPEAALRLEAMRNKQEAIDRSWLAQRFGARYMILRKEEAQTFRQLTTPQWKPVYRDDFACIYALVGAEAPR